MVPAPKSAENLAGKLSEKPANGPANSTGESFDQRLARLEQIVAELENEKIALEPAIERYKEGVELLRGCRALLDGFKKRVEELSADADVKPYAGDPDAASDAGRLR